MNMRGGNVKYLDNEHEKLLNSIENSENEADMSEPSNNYLEELRKNHG